MVERFFADCQSLKLVSIGFHKIIIVKLLGVTIDYELEFDKHISDICNKASRQLNVLKRIGKYLNKLGRLTIYYSFILSFYGRKIFCRLPKLETCLDWLS
jgi:hypothetical protein